MSKSPGTNGLFVYVSWKTRAGEPSLACDELRQIVFEAIRTRTRTHLCHILAMTWAGDQIHIVFRFPASLPVSQIARMSKTASDEAMTRFRQTCRPDQIPTRKFWETAYTSHSLNAAEASEAGDYLRRQINARSKSPEAADTAAACL